jgi:hypothetical protein
VYAWSAKISNVGATFRSASVVAYPVKLPLVNTYPLSNGIGPVPHITTAKRVNVLGIGTKGEYIIDIFI